jgi:hypothetical protein
VEFVQLAAGEGDDASCLNLNRARRPRLLGVDPRAFAERGAFTFAKTAPGLGGENPWLALSAGSDDGTVPGIADQTVITWGLGLSVGDTLEYRDERGRRFRVRLVAGLANSVFQGNVLIAREAFTERFPSVAGSRVFLVESLPARAGVVGPALSEALVDAGLDLQPAAERLALFHRVENTYLNIFLLLGGLALVLGNAGMAVVVLRNALERRRELALFRALGFTRRALRRMLFVENGFLFAAGVACGAVAGLAASLPAMASASANVPFLTLGVVAAVMMITGLAWTGLASWLVTRGDLLPALRDE